MICDDETTYIWSKIQLLMWNEMKKKERIRNGNNFSLTGRNFSYLMDSVPKVALVRVAAESSILVVPS